MNAVWKKALIGALCAGLAAPIAAQLTATEAPSGMQRPFGSENLVVPPNDAPPSACDKACLEGLARQYADALAKQDGSNLPWARRVRYAENGVTIMVADGTWATATAVATGSAPLIVADEKKGTVAWMGWVEDHGQPSFLALQMRVQGGRIADVANIIRHKEGRPPFSDPKAFVHDPAFGQIVPEGKRSPVGVMTGLAYAYFEAQEGKEIAPPFAKGCLAIENGVAMTGNLPAAKGEKGECATGFVRGLFKEYEDVRRNVFAIDPERGLVVAIGTRDMPAEKMEFEASDGATYKAEAHYPRSALFMTVFKIEDGKIARIETISNEVPYLMPPPWRR